MSQEENNKEMDPTKVVSEIKEEENSLLLPHDFDGIKELDNPAPRWLMYPLNKGPPKKRSMPWK
jgi:predicted metal-dependent phosphoesterase TrpH